MPTKSSEKSAPSEGIMTPNDTEKGDSVDAVISPSPEDSNSEQEVDAIATTLAGIDLCTLPESGLVDTPAAVAVLVDKLYVQPTVPPSLYIDLEGVNLSRHGSISILQIFVRPTNQTYLVDVHTLRDKAFSTRGTLDQTLKKILESDAIPKVFFDVRSDSDALYSHFHISLAGIWDLQLMELATRNFSRRCVNGPARCIQNDAPMGPAERAAWDKTKDKGLQLFAPRARRAI